MSFSDMSVKPDDWMREGLCSEGPDDATFFPSREAKNPPPLCSYCPVKQKCLDYGLENGMEGYWGGRWLSKADSQARIKEIMEERYAELYERGLNDAEIAAATGGKAGYGDSVVSKWRKRTGRLPQSRVVDGHWMNRFNQRSCRYGHAVETDSTMRTDGQPICITCAFGELRHAG